MKLNEFVPMTKRTGAGGSVTTVSGNEVSRSTPAIGGLQSTSYADGSVKDTLQTQDPSGTNITQTSVNGQTTNTDIQQGNMKLDTVPGANNSRIPQAKKLSYKSGITGNTVTATVPESVKEAGVGKITKQNTTSDVKPGETERQAKKLFPMNKDGKPKPLGVKGATPNQAFNLGLAENMSYTGTALRRAEKKKGIKIGTPEWFKHWFDLPYLREDINKKELLAKLKDQQRGRFTQAMLDALHSLVQSKGDRHSIGSYAFEVAKTFGFSPKALEKMYRDMHNLPVDSMVREDEVFTQQFEITPELAKLNNIFNRGGYEIRVVGGAVRDLALNKTPKDIDLASDATPIEMQKMFDSAGVKHIPTGIEHGTITAIINGEEFEITTLRADVETDGRHAEVEFVRSWEQDALRRDLTYNAMSMDFEGTLYDYHGGMDDLQNKVSRFVGDPAERIQEDYLRILRYFRFQGRMTNPKFEDDTMKAIADNASGLVQVSVERVWMELGKILGGGNIQQVLNAMANTGVTDAIGLQVQDINTVQDGGDPVINLARITNDSAVGKRWNMSNDQKSKLVFLIQNKGQTHDKKWYTDQMADGFDRSLLDALARYNSQDDMIQHINSFQQPTFPVDGNDLMKLGHARGPGIGKTLQALRTQWKQGNFDVSKDELLGSLTVQESYYGTLGRLPKQPVRKVEPVHKSVDARWKNKKDNDERAEFNLDKIDLSPEARRALKSMKEALNIRATEDVTQAQLNALEAIIDKVFRRVGIDVEFTRHFIDRANDDRNGEPITIQELGRLFAKEYKRWGKPIAQMGPDSEAVMKDLESDINIPFALKWNGNELELIAKTVMRKKNFRTSNKQFTVESMDNPYPYTWHERSNDTWTAYAELNTERSSDGRDDEDATLRIIADRVSGGDDWDDNERVVPTIWELSFMTGYKTHKTGAGDQFRIFATVASAFTDWWKQMGSKVNDIDELEFAANKATDGKSRAVLYARFAKKFAQMTGFNLETKQDSHQAVFTFVNPQSSFAEASVTEEVSVPEDVFHMKSRLLKVKKITDAMGNRPIMFRTFVYDADRVGKIIKKVTADAGRNVKTGSNQKQQEVLQKLGIKNPTFANLAAGKHANVNRTSLEDHGVAGLQNVFIPISNEIYYSDEVEDLGMGRPTGGNNNSLSSNFDVDKAVASYKKGWPPAGFDNEIIVDTDEYYLLNLQSFLLELTSPEIKDQIKRLKSEYDKSYSSKASENQVNDILKDLFKTKIMSYGDISRWIESVAIPFVDMIAASSR